MVNVCGRMLGFLRSMVSEANGTISNSRVCTSIVICFSTGWVTALLAKVRGPVTLPDLTAFVEKLGMYVSSICAALYGINRLADAWKNRRDQPPAQQ
jgi:hypothetical protein